MTTVSHRSDTVKEVDVVWELLAAAEPIDQRMEKLKYALVKLFLYLRDASSLNEQTQNM